MPKTTKATSRARAMTKAKVRPIAELWVDVYLGVVDTLLANADNDVALEGSAPDRAELITNRMLDVLEHRWPGMVV